MNQGKFLQFDAVVLAATAVVLSPHHDQHIDPAQPQWPSYHLTTATSGTSTSAATR